MLPNPRSAPLLLLLLAAVVVAVLAPGAPPVAGVVVAAGLLHRLAVVHRRHRPTAVPAVAAAPAIP